MKCVVKEQDSFTPKKDVVEFFSQHPFLINTLLLQISLGLKCWQYIGLIELAGIRFVLRSDKGSPYYLAP